MQNRVLRQPFTRKSARAEAEARARHRKHDDVRLANRLYSGKAWRALRAAQLRARPMCEQPGCVHRATVVDHVVAHRGDMAKFYDANNLSSLCKVHHDRKTVRVDGGFGRRRANDDDDESQSNQYVVR